MHFYEWRNPTIIIMQITGSYNFYPFWNSVPTFVYNTFCIKFHSKTIESFVWITICNSAINFKSIRPFINGFGYYDAISYKPATLVNVYYIIDYFIGYICQN